MDIFFIICTVYVKKKNLRSEVNLRIENGFLDEALFIEKIVFKDSCEIHCCCYLVLFRTSYLLKEKWWMFPVNKNGIDDHAWKYIKYSE